MTLLAVIGVTACLAAVPTWIGERSDDDDSADVSAPVSPGQTRDPSTGALLTSMHLDVRSASGSVYQARDDRRHGMDALTVLAAPSGGYLGVYHFQQAGVFVSAVSTSVDLRTWTFRGIFGRHASQPTVTSLSDGGFLAAVEADDRGLARRASRWVRFVHFASFSDLIRGHPDRTFDAPHTFGGATAGAEGTPDIESVHLAPTLRQSTVNVSFHYLIRGTDREARGTLTNFTHWETYRDSELDGALSQAGAQGKHGDRHLLIYRGAPFQLVEAQDRPGGQWQVYVYNRTSGTVSPLHLRTAAGSTSQANPAISEVLLPDGTPGLVTSLYIPMLGAAPHETGELLFYQRLGRADRSAPFLVAAGDIACRPGAHTTPTTCQQDATAQQVERLEPDTVLALGDLQYENGSLDSIRRSYGPSWGRFRRITRPVPGNHDYSAAGQTGYYDYFGAAAGQASHGYYSFDIGLWHVVALNSECARVACTAGSPQGRWLAKDLAAHTGACTMAFWHRPLFTSGQEGPSPETKPFWRALVAARADLVLNGHAHSYERFRPQDANGRTDELGGLLEIVAGTGGKNQEASNRVKPNSVVRLDSTFGVLELLMRPDGYDWHFSPLDPASDSDSGSAQCH